MSFLENQLVMKKGTYLYTNPLVSVLAAANFKILCNTYLYVLAILYTPANEHFGIVPVEVFLNICIT